MEFLASSATRGSWEEIFVPGAEIRVNLPPRFDEIETVKRAVVFDTAPVLEYFTFEANNSVARWKKGQDISYSSVKSLLKSSEKTSISVKFISNSQLNYFGLCNESVGLGFSGYTANGWNWSCNSGGAFHGNKNNDYAKHTLGDLSSKEVEMTYDENTKTVTIS